MKTDYAYISRSVSRLSGVPVRVFKDGAEICRDFPVNLPCDPMELYKEEILSIKDHAGYYCTPYFHYYGVLNADGAAFVIGPTSQIMANEQKLRELAFRADVLPEDTAAFVNGMNAIRRLPVESLLQALCVLNHFLNHGEKLKISDFSISESAQTELKSDVEQTRTAKVYEEEAKRQSHNTLEIEEALMSIVRSGDTVALRRWLASAPAVHGGTIATDQLRQLRNTFIVTATLTLRAAIRGGMSQDDAFFSLRRVYKARRAAF